MGRYKMTVENRPAFGAPTGRYKMTVVEDGRGRGVEGVTK